MRACEYLSVFSNTSLIENVSTGGITQRVAFIRQETALNPRTAAAARAAADTLLYLLLCWPLWLRRDVPGLLLQENAPHQVELPPASS